MWLNVKSALVSAGIAALVAVGGYVIGVGDVFKLDPHAIVNAGVLSALTAIVSFIKSSLTTDGGKFAGIQIK